MAKSPVTFLEETRNELKQVSWPTQAEVVRLTMLILVISIIVGLFIGGIDFLLTQLTQLVLK